MDGHEVTVGRRRSALNAIPGPGEEETAVADAGTTVFSRIQTMKDQQAKYMFEGIAFSYDL